MTTVSKRNEYMQRKLTVGFAGKAAESVANSEPRRVALAEG